MATCLTLPAKLSHPALFTGLATPPLTPTSPSTPTRATTATFAPQPPVPSYPMLRANHAHAVRYVISKLRWEQKNNMYLPNQDAEWNHDRVIEELEKELEGVKTAQERLDRFPHCYAPVYYPQPHGPRTKEEDEEITKLERERAKLLDAKLETHFPYIKQLFIGPMTKQQYRNDKYLRERLQVGELDDLEFLLPSENMRMLKAGFEKKAAAGPKKSYQQQRFEKEKAKVAAFVEIQPPRKVSVVGASAPRPRIGPLTKEEYLATLPHFGPPTKEESMLPKQREHRHDILDWFRRPWGKYDAEAAGLIEQLAEIAKKRTEEVRKAKVEQVKEGKK